MFLPNNGRRRGEFYVGVSTDFTSVQNCLFSLLVPSVCLSTQNTSTHFEVICEISQEDYILLHIIYDEVLPILKVMCMKQDTE